MKEMRCKFKSKGFSLIELVIVLAVMAIIALIAIPNFNAVRENSKVKADKLSCESIKKSLSILVLDEIIKVDQSSNSIVLAFDNNKNLKDITMQGVVGGEALNEIGAKAVLKSAFSNVKAPQANVQILEDGSLGDIGITDKYHIWIEQSGDIKVLTLIKK